MGLRDEPTTAICRSVSQASTEAWGINSTSGCCLYRFFFSGLPDLAMSVLPILAWTAEGSASTTLPFVTCRMRPDFELTHVCAGQDV